MSINPDEHICNICGSKTETILKLNYHELAGMATEYTMNVDMCKKCDYIFTSNPFDSEKLANRYKNYSKFEFDDDSHFLEDNNDYKIRSIRQKEFIMRNIDSNDVRNIFEVGAASGYNLSLYENMDKYGVEPSPNNCKNAKKNYNIDMYCGVFDDYYKNKKNFSWDLIFLSHTLEHIVKPMNFIKKCSEFCNKYMFIEVPTFDFKISNEPFGAFVEEHVNTFTLKSLQSLMNACGFTLINAEIILCLEQRIPAGFPSIQTLWKKEKSEEIIKKYEIINDTTSIVKRYISNSNKIMKTIRKIIDSIDSNEKIAIWGTGHHLSFLLANTSLEKKNITRVYDSDPKKKGMKIRGHPIQQYNVDDIKRGDVESILIASFVAQIAIEKIIKSSGVNVKIITLYP